MLAQLSEAIETLMIAPESGALAEVHHLMGRLEAKATMAVAAFDQAGAYELDGAASMTAWMRVHLGCTNQSANRVLRTGRRLRDLPVTAAAWDAGRLSSGQVEVITANLKDRHAQLFAEHEAEVVPLVEPLGVVETAQAMQAWVVRADAQLDEPEPPEEPPAKLHAASTLDGRGYLNGSFDAESMEVITKGLQLAGHPDLPGEPIRSFAERQGQAMVDVFRFFLDHQDAKLGKRHRPHVNVTIDLPELTAQGPGHTLTGIPLDATSIHRLLCDANVHRVVTDGAGSILDYGRATRTIPPAVYTSLVLRDAGCRFPGCDRPPAWCDGHHIWHWEDGGPTCLSNLVLLCSRHHHLIHKPGWQLKLRPDGTAEVTRPDGHVMTSDPLATR